MESILARALEYTLKYWLKSFSRDQFKLQGRTAQLSNLDINGDALHASVGLPPALGVETARVGKLEITLPSVSNVQVEPILVQIDRLDLVLKENADSDAASCQRSSGQSSSTSTKSSGYGFADKIADGMTIQVGIVNLLIETCGGTRGQNTTWASPLASITMRNLLLYTTNEYWEVVNLKEARDFSNNKKNIYIFKKLEWGSLSIDLLPHPDMFMDAHFTCSGGKENQRDDDGAKRLFFGGERFLEGISGRACITIKRTELNNPLGLEVQLYISEAVCPALSEPGLRALLRFMTGLYVCLNRGDLDPLACQSEAAGCSLVSITVDHIFLCIKDAEFQLELLMQSLFFSRASLSDGKKVKNLSRVMVGGLFLRDTFSRPPCTLIQPSMQVTNEVSPEVPEFAKNFCPPIFPLEDNQWQVNPGVPLICLHSLQINPCPVSLTFASQTVIDCQPILIDLQEDSCLRISSFLADGIVVNPGSVLPSCSISSFIFNLKGFDLTVPLDAGRASDFDVNDLYPPGTYFSGAKLHVKDFCFVDSPSVKCNLLNLNKDPACFSLWDGQPIDASQKKWTIEIAHLSLSLGNCNELEKLKSHSVATWWKCVELHEACFEAAMVTADGSPLLVMPPPEGIVRIGIACGKCLSNTSLEQLFFVLDVYSYFGKVSEKLKKVSKTNNHKNKVASIGEELLLKIPSDTAVILSVHDLQLKFLETSLSDFQGMPLVQFSGDGLFVKVGHRTLGGAFAVSTNLTWNHVQVDCVDAGGIQRLGNYFDKEGVQELSVNGDYSPQMRAVFWIDSQRKLLSNAVPFLEINLVHVVPYKVEDLECHSLNIAVKIAGVRLGGGMNYTESLLHRFGILGPDGGPGEGLQKGLQNLSSGPLADLFKSAPMGQVDVEEDISENGASSTLLKLGKPDDIDVCVDLKDWLFALEGIPDSTEEWLCNNYAGTRREDMCWHMTFSNLQVKAKSDPKAARSMEQFSTDIFPVKFVMVSVEGLQALKPQVRKKIQSGIALQVESPSSRGMGSSVKCSDQCGGLNVEISLVTSLDEENVERTIWEVENIKFSVKEQIEATATKLELEQLLLLCRSEIDSMGRIAAGILRIFKLEESLGKDAIDQLSSLGSEGLDRIFSPEKLSRRNSIASVSFTPSNHVGESPHPSMESTINSLESVLADSQTRCSALLVELSSPETSAQHLANVKQLNQRLENMQLLLTKLRTQI